MTLLHLCVMVQDADFTNPTNIVIKGIYKIVAPQASFPCDLLHQAYSSVIVD